MRTNGLSTNPIILQRFGC